MTTAVHDPTKVLRDALQRQRELRTPAVHPFPVLVRHPERWCRDCRSHLANQGGDDRRQLCPGCSDQLGGRP